MFSGRSTTDDAQRGAGSQSVQQLRELQLDAIKPNPSQPRRRFDEAALQGLADSIGERGVLQPVLVHTISDGSYELVAGERRWRAARIAGLQSIPALVSGYDDAAALEAAVIENMAREDLTPVEEARACVTLIAELGLTHEQVGRRVGRTRGVVTNIVRLLNLSEEILDLLDSRELKEGHGRALLMINDLDTRAELARMAVRERWSVRALEDRAHEARAREMSANVAATQSAHDPRAGGGGCPAREAALLERVVDPGLDLVEKARACAMMTGELGLAPEQIAERVGRSRSAIANLLRLLNLSEEILELVAQGKLGIRHGRALLTVKDVQVRGELARMAVRERWPVRTLEARALGKDEKQDPNPDAAVQRAAQRWGELLGIEVRVRPMARGRARLEVQFGSAETAIALAERLSAAAVSR
jgi:ParB family chromosome partitioning protein